MVTHSRPQVRTYPTRSVLFDTGSPMRKQRHVAYTNCPVEAALDIIGGKWKSIILFRLLEQTRRFNELRRLLPAITQRTLTTQLRELEGDGLVQRTIYPEIPPHVDYRLTALGLSLLPVLNALKTWSESHMPERMARLRPNPSIEGTSKSGLRPLAAAPRVKR